MSSNGYSRGGRSGRTPHFLTVGLLVVICILAFNYWNVSSKNKVLQKESEKMRDNIEEMVLRRVHLEKRTESLNKELQNNNKVYHDTREEANTCQANLKEATDELDKLRLKVTDDAAEIKALEEGVEHCNGTLADQMDDLEGLKGENRELHKQLMEKGSDVVKVHQELQAKEVAERNAQALVERYLSEIDSLKEQLLQQQQQQLMQQNRLGPGSNQIPNSQPLQQANQQLPINNLPPQNNLQQPLQAEINQQANRNYMGVPGFQGIPADPQGQQLNLQMHQPNLGEGLGVPQLNVPLKAREGEQGLPGQENQVNDANQVIPNKEAEEGHESSPDEVESPDNVGDGPNGAEDSPNNPAGGFLQEGVRKDDDTEILDGPPNGQGDSQHLEDGAGVSKMESESEVGNNPQDPDHGIDDNPSAGHDDGFRFAGGKHNFGNDTGDESSESSFDGFRFAGGKHNFSNDTGDESSESSYDYEDDDDGNRKNEDKLEDGRDQFEPGKNYLDVNAAGEGDDLQIQAGFPQDLNNDGDDRHLRFNPGGL